MLSFSQGKEAIKQWSIVHSRNPEVAEESSIVDVVAAVRLQFVPLLSRPGQRHAEVEGLLLAVAHRHFPDGEALENPPDHQEHVRVATSPESLQESADLVRVALGLSP